MNNPLQAMGCTSDIYEQRLALQRQQLDGLIVRTQLEESRAAELQAEASVLASDSARLSQRIASLQRDVDQARLRLSAARADTDEARARNTALQEELAELELRIQSVSSGPPADIEAQMEEIERRKEAMRRFSEVPIF